MQQPLYFITLNELITQLPAGSPSFNRFVVISIFSTSKLRKKIQKIDEAESDGVQFYRKENRRLKCMIYSLISNQISEIKKKHNTRNQTEIYLPLRNVFCTPFTYVCIHGMHELKHDFDY
jgi:hypothetical protein